MKKIKLVLACIVMAGLILIALFGIFSSISNKQSWDEAAACKEVKSIVYKSYGEIPEVSGERLWKDGQNYIVIVKFKIPDIGWEGSYACHIYGYGEDNNFLKDRTRELSYGYKYDTEELKALWAL